MLTVLNALREVRDISQCNMSTNKSNKTHRQEQTDDLISNLHVVLLWSIRYIPNISLFNCSSMLGKAIAVFFSQNLFRRIDYPSVLQP